ncbi:MAG: hypothetical protein IT527_01035 [Nitrosomonas sp.]|nr:hypothetical protein [Nitrosomonas sp.]
MGDEKELLDAYHFAKSHTTAGLKQYLFDIDLIAAKELGNDERDFAHAFHVIQYFVDRAKRRIVRG